MTRGTQGGTAEIDVRLDRISSIIQPLLNLAGLLADLLEGARIVRGVCPASSTTKPILTAEIVSRRAAYLGHLVVVWLFFLCRGYGHANSRRR